MSLAFACTRLAPSPTGSLHLGHARTFLITWWLARSAGARIIMRMEDLDARRAKPESVQLTYDDLRWLGMDWDLGPPEAGGDCGPGLRGSDDYVQSHRRPGYEDALDCLWQTGAVYPCTCSRAEIATSVAQSAGAPQEGDVQIRYPGTCRPRAAGVQSGRTSPHRGAGILPASNTSIGDCHGPKLPPALGLPASPANSGNLQTATRQAVTEQVKHATGKPVCWRFHVPETTVCFEDGFHGQQAWEVHADSGDFPVTRFDGTPAYQLAVVVDDGAMGIDMVIRGDDLLGSTPRQLLIYRALGLPEPRFVHVPLVVGPDGKRLAKRHGESRIAQFREQGVRPETIVGWVAWRSGQIPAPRDMNARELVGRFDLSKLPRERIILAPEDLAWLSRL